MDKTVINPPTLPRPRGFSHGILVTGGRLLFLAGQTGSNAEGQISAPGDLVAQYEQVLYNLKTVVEAAGGKMQDITQITIFVLEGIEVKDSIAVDGACLTVTKRGENWFHVDTMPETLRRTRFGSLQAGDPVNLERSLSANGRVGGHMVQGHIEACASVLSVRE